MDPLHMFNSLFGVQATAPPKDEAKRRHAQEVAVVHAALVELGISKPDDCADAHTVVKLNRLCSRSGAAFEGLLRGLSTLCNDAPLLVDRLTPSAKAVAARMNTTTDDGEEETP